MDQIIQLKKYQQAMQQIGALSDALFTTQAHLEMAMLRIKELEEALEAKEHNNGEQHSSVKD